MRKVSSIPFGDSIKCEICGNFIGSRIGNHLRVHSMSVKEYLKIYPNAALVSESFRVKLSQNSLNSFQENPDRRLVHSLHMKRIMSDPIRINLQRATFTKVLEKLWEDPKHIKKMSDLGIKRANDPLDLYGKGLPKISRRRKFVYDGINGNIQMLSSWEVNFANDLDSLGINWVYEEYRFPYLLNEKTHHYTPDFYIPLLKLFVEIKPAYLEKDPIVVIKIDSVYRNGFFFLLVTEDNWKEKLNIINVHYMAA